MPFIFYIFMDTDNFLLWCHNLIALGSVPQYVGQVIRGSGCGVCDSAGSSSCPPGNCGSPSTCDSQTPINDLYMKNCGSFNVYYLTPPPRCQFAYCMSTWCKYESVQCKIIVDYIHLRKCIKVFNMLLPVYTCSLHQCTYECLNQCI